LIYDSFSFFQGNQLSLIEAVKKGSQVEAKRLLEFFSFFFSFFFS